MKNIVLEIQMQYDNFFDDFEKDKNLKLFLEFERLNLNWQGKMMNFTKPKNKKKDIVEIVNKKNKLNKNKLF